MATLVTLIPYFKPQRVKPVTGRLSWRFQWRKRKNQNSPENFKKNIQAKKRDMLGISNSQKQLLQKYENHADNKGKPVVEP